MKARKGSHSVFSIQLHLVFVTKYRRKSLTAEILTRMEQIFWQVCDKTECKIIEFGGEFDHVHLLIDMHPRNSPSQLVGSLKASSSRILKREFEEHLKQFYWGKDAAFWSGSFYIASTGGAPIEQIKRYIESQDSPTD